MSKQQNNSLEQVVNTMRDNILRSQSQASTTSITSFDSLIEQMKVFVMQLNDKSSEILRLQELCKKNKIDYAITPEAQKPTIVAPPQKTKTTDQV